MSKGQSLTLEQSLALVAVAQERRLKLNSQPRFDLSLFDFEKQNEFNRGCSKRNVICTSGRAGKSVLFVSRFLHNCLKKPGKYLWIGKTRGSAKRIAWDYFKDINREYGLGGKPMESELILYFTNSQIHLVGCDVEKEIEKIRGTPWREVFIDEAQSYPMYLKSLILDAISPRLMDYDGIISVGGTPGPTRYGAFWDIWNNEPGFKDWKKWHWTIFDNPYIEKKSGKSPWILLQEEMDRRGVTATDPSIRREFFGEWSEDTSVLIYKFNRLNNTYETLPDYDWKYVIGVDLGFDDADAIVVWAYSDKCPEIYMVYEFSQSGLSVSELADKLKKVQTDFRSSRCVIDAGGLGKKIQVELLERFGVYCEAAEKSEKFAYIELFNSDLRLGRVKVKKDAKIVHEWLTLQRDVDSHTLKEDPGCDNHLSDAALYAYREAKHHGYKEPARIIANAQETNAYASEALKRRLKEQARNRNQEWWRRV